MCAYHGVRDVNFLKNFANVLNKGFLAMILVGKFDMVIMDPPWENKSVKRSRK